MRTIRRGAVGMIDGTDASSPMSAAVSLTYPLGELRRSRAVTQVELAQRLEVAQATVSKFEKSSPAVSTVRRYVEALGGRLELVAVFDDDQILLDC